MSGVTTMMSSAVRLTAPLVFAGSGEYVAERSGTLNISIEAMMLNGAFFSLYGSAVFGNVVMGLLCGMAAGLVVAWIHANFSHRLSANTFVVGLTLNVLVLGVTSFLSESVDMSKQRQAGEWEVPLLSKIPVVGASVFTKPWPIYLLFVVVPLAWWLVARTRWGLEVRACGEDPQAADVTGINVNKRRRQSLYFCGLCAGLGGAYLGLQVGRFNTNMTAGRGFIVNAAVIFGGWRLSGTLLGCLLFGTADALYLGLQALGYHINPQLLFAAPYILALLAMCFFAKRNRAPAALAVPFERGLK